MKKIWYKYILVSLACLMFSGCAMQAKDGEENYRYEAPRLGYDKIEDTRDVMVENASVTPQPTPGPTQVKTLVPMNDSAGGASEFSRLAPTVNMSFEELVGDNGIYDEPTVFPAQDTFYVLVDLYHQVVLVYEKDARGTYTIPVRYMVCSTGSKKNPSPSGVFKSGTHKVRYGLFVNDNVYGQYWTNITRRIYFHSLLYTRKDANSYTSSSYNKLGSRASHGCIRLLVPDARWMYYHIAPGTTVEIHRGSKEDTVTADIKKNLTRPALPKERPGLIKGDIPNTDNWSLDTYLEEYNKLVTISYS